MPTSGAIIPRTDSHTGGDERDLGKEGTGGSEQVGSTEMCPRVTERM